MRPVEVPSPRRPGQLLLALAAGALVGRGADMASAQLADDGALLLAGQVGFSDQFSRFFAVVDGSATSCSQAFKDRQAVHVRDFELHQPFDDASRGVVLDGGSHACVSVPVHHRDGQVLAVISAHYRRRGQHDPTTVLATAEQVGRLLSAPDDAALSYQRADLGVAADAGQRIAALQREVAQLHQAMSTRAMIEQAKGIVMAATGGDADAAFALIVAQSQHQNRKLREIAAEIVQQAMRIGR